MNADDLYFDIYKITNSDVEANVKKITPVYPEEISVMEYHKAILTGLRENFSVLTPREYCVAKVHLGILKKIVSTNRPGIIFESDIVIDFEKVRRFIQLKKPDDYFFHLGVLQENFPKTNLFWIKKFKINDGDVWYQLFKTDQLWGAYAYAITPRVARAIVDAQKSVIRKADDWTGIFSSLRYKVYHYPLFFHPIERGELHCERSESRVSFKKALLGKIKLKLYSIVNRYLAIIMFRRISIKDR
ncbi:glycosyltransferase family 25 protein [Limnobacter sp.]|uniref:glycosyltransferase family 25 protein n=1 Tax=Limnobacter sp. TaxID=2003368 RepID=UPI00311EDA05